MAVGSEALARILAEARAEYRRTLPGKLAQIEGLWLAQQTGGMLPGEKFEELKRLVHALAGSAGTFGLPGVSEAARALELMISPADGPAAGVPVEQVEVVDKLLEALRRSVDID